MLKSTLLASTALVALLLTTACEQKTQQAQKQDSQVTELAAQPAPNAAERTAAEAANEVEQVAAPNAQITPTELAAGLGAKDVPNPATTLSTASVKTTDGQALGEVRSVVVGPDGKAEAVIVEVGGFLNVGERGVSIEAAKLTYLKDRNILIAALSRSDIEKLPAVPALRSN
jgi:dsDNA-specific endonuclease/ATPase MutS2